MDTSTWNNDPGRPFNQVPYPGDTDGDISHESFPFERLENGRTYFALVRTVGPDGNESKSSNVVTFTPLARGVFVVSVNHEAVDGGFNFETETQVPGRDPRSDIYLYATKEKIGLSSPYRLGAGMRKTKFGGSSNSAPVETLQITRGQSIEVITKTGVAEIKIEDISGDYPAISARISYIFHPEMTQ